VLLAFHPPSLSPPLSSQLYRLIDRKSAEYVLGPTHEEEVTKLVGDEVESWRSLPVKVYQICE